jgi:glycosyltransferase involved in cell wall biosynthesis
VRQPAVDHIDFSVVIPAYNEATVIGRQLDALVEQSWDGSWEVLVVDNRSTDGTAEIVHEYQRRDSRFRVVAANERQGISYARNAGIEASRGRSFALVDADDLVADGWVAAMGTALRAHPFVTGPLELARLNPPRLVDSRGRRDETESPTFSGLFPTAHGNNMGMQKALWEKIDRFDEDPRLLGCEDMEFSMRAWLDGIVLFFATEAVVHYRYRTDPRVLWEQGRRYGKSRPMLVKKLQEAGRPRPPRFSGWRSWAWLVVHAPDLVRRDRRAGWVWVAGNRLGQLEGSIRYRALFV